MFHPKTEEKLHEFWPAVGGVRIEDNVPLTRMEITQWLYLDVLLEVRINS